MFLAHHVHLTPAMRAVPKGMARAGYPPIHTLTTEAAKDAYERGANVLELPKAQLAREDLTVVAGAASGRASPSHAWRFAPLLAEAVEGVAPAWFGPAEYEPVADDAPAYAAKLRTAQVSVDLEIYRGVTHEFIKMGRAISEARQQAHADAARALARALQPSKP